MCNSRNNKSLKFENKSDLNPFSLFSKNLDKRATWVYFFNQFFFSTAIFFSPHLQQEPELYEKTSHVAIWEKLLEPKDRMEREKIS